MGTTAFIIPARRKAFPAHDPAGAQPELASTILFSIDGDELTLRAVVDCLIQAGHMSRRSKNATNRTKQALDWLEQRGFLKSRVSSKRGTGKLWRKA